jgi:hypothetical protein
MKNVSFGLVIALLGQLFAATSEDIAALCKGTYRQTSYYYRYDQVVLTPGMVTPGGNC